MKSALISVAAAAAVALWGGMSPAQAQALNGQAVKQLFPGQFEASVKGYRVFFSGTKGGRLRGVAYGREDVGRWYMSGAQLCVTWNDWTDGKPICGVINQKSGWYVAKAKDGTVLKFRRAEVASQ
jgi:hypothetical protein